MKTLQTYINEGLQSEGLPFNEIVRTAHKEFNKVSAYKKACGDDVVWCAYGDFSDADGNFGKSVTFYLDGELENRNTSRVVSILFTDYKASGDFDANFIYVANYNPLSSVDIHSMYRIDVGKHDITLEELLRIVAEYLSLGTDIEKAAKDGRMTGVSYRDFKQARLK